MGMDVGSLIIAGCSVLLAEKGREGMSKSKQWFRRGGGNGVHVDPAAGLFMLAKLRKITLFREQLDSPDV
jgi:hypothetical protein